VTSDLHNRQFMCRLVLLSLTERRVVSLGSICSVEQIRDSLSYVSDMMKVRMIQIAHGRV